MMNTQYIFERLMEGTTGIECLNLYVNQALVYIT